MTVFAFALFLGLGFFISAILLYAMLRFENHLSFELRASMGVLSGTNFLNTFAQFLPTPYLPWTIILGRAALAVFILLCVRFMFKLVQDNRIWPK